MVENWLLELLWAIGRFFIHPLFYLFTLIALAHGVLRIKRERRSFHIRVQDLYEELKFTYTKGLLMGLLVSVVIFALGMSLPFGTVVILAIVTALLSFTFQLRWLSAAFTVGLTLLSVMLIPESLSTFFVDFSETSLASLSILAALLLVAEGILVIRTGHQKTSPFLKMSTRGLTIGSHQANRTWMLPLLLLVPGGTLTSTLPWWPALSINGEPFLLLFIPFFLGFSQRVQGSLPQESIKITGLRIMWLGVCTLLIAVASIWVTPLVFVSVFFAIIGREFITIRQRINDDSAAFYFSKRDHGLMILGILPQSPAEKMNLNVGEMIMKVNGYSVHTVDEFYQALQKNRAFCKLEVIDFNGEIRFAQRALYDGEHHELGILFVQEDKKWKDEAV